MERYRQENNTFCIDVSFHEFKQLYDGRDPSPFQERDLDENLVRYLVMGCEEIPRDQPIKIVMIAPDLKSETQQKDDFILALHQYFDHEVRLTNNELKYLFKQGRVSFLFAFSFLTFCIFLAVKFAGDSSIFNKVLYEGLSIMGWVALWKPLNIFLYEWWPYVRKKRVYKLLATIQVEFKS